MGKDRKIDVVILGLLAHEDLTGYDIKKRIDTAIGFFWKGSFGSIYPSLGDMEKQGLVQKKSSGVSGGREKIIYHITSAGRTFLKKWLNDEKVGNELKYETLLKLYFGGAETSEVAVRNIEIFEVQVKENLAILRIYKENLEKVLDKADHKYYYLTVTFGIDTYEAYLKWCKKARAFLERH